MKIIGNTLRGWLIDSGYTDVARTIDDILEEWKEKGNKQRRNWWDVLAGGKDGRAYKVAGREIPVLRAAQLRKNIEVTPNALWNENEKPLPQKGE